MMLTTMLSRIRRRQHNVIEQGDPRLATGGAVTDLHDACPRLPASLVNLA